MNRHSIRERKNRRPGLNRSLAIRQGPRDKTCLRTTGRSIEISLPWIDFKKAGSDSSVWTISQNRRRLSPRPVAIRRFLVGGAFFEDFHRLFGRPNIELRWQDRDQDNRRGDFAQRRVSAEGAIRQSGEPPRRKAAEVPMRSCSKAVFLFNAPAAIRQAAQALKYVCGSS